MKHTNNHQFLTREYPGRFDLFSLTSRDSHSYPFLLESTAHQEAGARRTSGYDILFCFPQSTLRKTATGELELDGVAIDEVEFLPALDRIWSQQCQPAHDTSLPFTGGWFLYLGYELVAEIEPGLQLPTGDSLLPIAQASRIPAAVIYDHLADTTTVVVETAYAGLLERIIRDLQAYGRCESEPAAIACPRVQEETPQDYLDGVRAVIDYIREGDVFQVNLSRQWQAAPFAREQSYALYRRLRETNPAPFAGYASFAGGAIISSSPERLVRVWDGTIETRPIAGTRPRQQVAIADQRMRDELLAHPKERAEHVMLIDLERNDLGRLCEFGSIQVDEMMSLESYAHVHHIVSNIGGRLRDGISPGQVIAAVFPGGTITGCPKVRCMEIIAELEQSARGPYTGSFGYLTHSGNMDLNILIRTFSQEQNRIRFRTGAGLVADSVAEHELAETRAKARGLILALEAMQEQQHAHLLG